MGHYGCGGVAASMLPVSLPLAHPAHIAVQTWIQPIREIYQSSTRCVHCWCIAILIVTCILTRPEIVAHRNKSKYIPLTELPDLHDRTFLTRLWNRELSNFFFEKLHYAHSLKRMSKQMWTELPDLMLCVTCAAPLLSLCLHRIVFTHTFAALRITTTSNVSFIVGTAFRVGQKWTARHLRLYPWMGLWPWEWGSYWSECQPWTSWKGDPEKSMASHRREGETKEDWTRSERKGEALNSIIASVWLSKLLPLL